MSTSLRDLVPIAAVTPTPTPASTGTARSEPSDPTGFAAALQTATAATTGGAAAPGTTTTTSSGQTSEKPTGEQLQAVPDAPYAKITSGADTGLYLNEAAGNPREGEAFRLEQHDAETWHVYGTGSSETIEVIRAASATGTTGTTGTTDTTGTTGGSTSTTSDASTSASST